MDGSQIVTEALAELVSRSFALVSGIVIGIGVLYLGKAMWIILRRRKY